MKSFDPSDENYWGRKMYPMELEDERNKKTKELSRSVDRLLNLKKFKNLRRSINDLTDWETPEDRLNNVYLQPGYWELPPSPLDYFKLNYSKKHEIEGSYKLPFYLFLNSEIKTFIKDTEKLKALKSECNDAIGTYPQLQKRIDRLELIIKLICEELWIINKRYAKYLIGVIRSSRDVESYENDRFTSHRIDLLEELEIEFYGAVFGSEFAIYEKVEFFVKRDDWKRHIHLIKKLIPISKEYLICQITKNHFKKGSYTKWENSKPTARRVLQKIEEIDLITEEKVLAVIREFDSEFVKPNRSRIVDPDGTLTKSTFSDALSEIIIKNTDVESIEGDYLKRRIQKEFSFNCWHGKKR